MARRISPVRYLSLLLICWYCLTPTNIENWRYPLEKAQSNQMIYLVNHGWHTGLIIPSSTFNTELNEVVGYFNQAPFFEFGWGDSGFYQAEQYTPALVANALLLPSESVMHVVAVPINPMRYFSGSDIIAIELPTEAFKPMVEMIADSFKRSVNRRLLKLRVGLYGESLFFEGKGNYHGLYTCNSWTADVLAAAGMPLQSRINLTADSVMNAANTALQTR